ncbi:MAG: hypothetical protein A4E38_00025 [Methanoregulaceae archaeon PtaB.Bin108]|nr:MAG: hypothetical protein A4E38_00025 [Methanoregulaceae archaeon PtaB.Bin108]
MPVETSIGSLWISRYQAFTVELVLGILAREVNNRQVSLFPVIIEDGCGKGCLSHIRFTQYLLCLLTILVMTLVDPVFDTVLISVIICNHEGYGLYPPIKRTCISRWF